MIYAPKELRSINSFKFVSVPSPRDVFMRYGERASTGGEYSTDAMTQASPSIVNTSSVIDEIINAQRMLETDCQP